MKCFLRNPVIRRGLIQSLGLIGLALLIGALTLNRARLPFYLGAEAADAKPVATVTLEQMREIVESGKVICIDARSLSEFKKGHIKGAISLSPTDFDQELPSHLELFTQNQPVVIYCDGLGCDLSYLLARRLAAIGMDQVSVLEAGWNGWKSTGLPIEQ